MGNTPNTIKNLTGIVTGSESGDYIDERLPEGDKYFGFVNVTTIANHNPS
jgi:hypothetical protein